jgi:hypothetical protein
MAVVLAGTVAFAGCGSAEDVGVDSIETSATQEAASGSMAGQVTLLDVSDMFSDRDKEIGYDEEECVKVVLQGDTAEADSEGVQVDGNCVTITQAGDYLLSGSLQGQLIIDADEEDKVHLILDGAEISCESSAALYVSQADKVFVTTASGSENLLETTGEYVAIDDHNIDGAVFSRSDITFNGAGSLKAVSAVGNGIVCKDDLVITSGSYEIQAGKHGLEGKDSVRIASGDIVISAEVDGIHSGNDEDETVGYTYIAGGNLTLTVGDDGIHSDTQLVIAGGSINVTESYEGLEGMSVEITDGDINVKASDDGINAAGGKDGSGGMGKFGGDSFGANDNNTIIVSGGKITVDADGDGIDSNGSLQVNGGEIVVYGSTSGGDSALDFDGNAVVNGGTVIALGASQMAENFGSDSTQCAIMVNLQGTQAAGTTAELRTADGTVLLSCTATKTYNSAIFSCGDIQVGSSYTVVMGDETTEVEMTETIYGSGMGMGGRGGKGGQGGFGGDKPDGGNFNGERPDDGNFDGERPDGGNFDGEQPDGGNFDGEKPDGGNFDGEKPDGKNFDGGKMNGEKPELPEGQSQEQTNQKTEQSGI